MAPTIYPNDRGDAAELARRLLEAAGTDRHDDVRTVTDGPAGIAFDVPDEVYDRVFSNPGGDPGGDPAADSPQTAPSGETPAQVPAAPGSDAATDTSDDPAPAVPRAGSPGRQRRRAP